MSKDTVAPVTKVGTPWSFLLGLLFIILKVTNHIAWAWWIVLLPFYLPIVLFTVFMILLGVVGLVAWFVYAKNKNKIDRIINKW